MPEGCKPKYIGLRKDGLFKFCFQATYNHDSIDAIEALPSEKLGTVPAHLSTASKTVTFGAGVSDLQEKKALEACLRWAWAKHVHFYGGERPSWIVQVAGDL